MPIKPENKARYPANWKSEIRPAVLERAGHCCEGSPDFPDCRAENYKPHPDTGSKVVLTVGHLDHTPENCDGMESGGKLLPVEESNLKAWCQRCHLNYDKDHHALNAAKTRRKKSEQADLVDWIEEQGAKDD